MFMLSDIILFVTTLIGVTFMLSISALAVFIVNVNIEGRVIGDILYDDPLTGNTLMAFTELTEDGIKMRDMLTYSVWYGNDMIKLRGDEYNITEISTASMDKLTKKPYKLVLETPDRDIVIASYSDVLGKKSASMTITADNKEGRLVLWRD